MFYFSDKVNEEGWSFTSSRHKLYLELDNSESSHSYQELQPLPELHVDPPRAAVYESGEDFNVTAFVQLEEGTAHRPFYIHGSLDAIDLSTSEVYLYMDPDKIFLDRSDLSSLNKSLTVLTSSTTVSGYLTFSVGMKLEGSLVLSVQIFRTIEVRPSNQPTTLPPNYLGIANVFRKKSRYGNEQEQCRVGKECVIGCLGYGDEISAMDVVKVLPDGGREPVPSAIQQDSSSLMNGDTTRLVHWTFQAERDSGDEYGITTYECSATDQSQTREVTKLLDVQVVLKGGLDQGMSNVTVEGDDMNPQVKHITFNCAVYGRPLPEVTFYSGTSAIFSMDSHEPESVTITGETSAVATKTLTVDVDYFRSHNYRLHEDDELPYCGLYSSSAGEYIHHTFDIPDLGLSMETK